MSPNSLYIIVAGVYTVVIGYDVYNWLRDQSIVAPEIKLQRFKSKINRTVLILGLTMLVVSVLFRVNVLRYSMPIPFDQIDEITLKDFKGYRTPYQTLDGERDFAFITTSIDWTKVDKGLEVQAHFHPARSYVYNDRIVDPFLLRHELCHFRITEIFARRFRQQLSKDNEMPSDDVVNEILQDTLQINRHKTLHYRHRLFPGHDFSLLKEERHEQAEDQERHARRSRESLPALQLGPVHRGLS